MGYLTDYSLNYTAPDGSDLPAGRLAELEEYLENTNFSYDMSWSHLHEDSLKWYEHDEEMSDLSRLFPTTLFCLHGEGEESGDLWNKYYLNGKMQECRAEVVYPEFNPAKLKEVK